MARSQWLYINFTLMILRYNTVFSLACALCMYLFQNSIPSFENSVDPDKLASDEAS